MTWKVGPGMCGSYTVYDDEGWYLMNCQNEQRAQLIASAPELASTLHELLWEMVMMADEINRYDPPLIKRPRDFETDNIPACQKARELLGRLGMHGPPKGRNNEKAELV